MSVNTTKAYKNKNEKYRNAKRITLTGTFANLILTVFKFVAGVLGGSQAMVADAIHSLSDFASDIVVLVGLKIAKKPSDKNHPYGHGRAETFSTLLVGVALLFLGFNVLKEAVSNIITRDFATPGKIAFIAAIISIIVKEAMYRITINVAKKIGSPSLYANAWHHRTDALSSIAALIGIGGAMLKREWQVLDPIAAILVAILVVKVGMDIVREAVSDFMETAVDDETMKKIKSIAINTKSVLDVHSIKSRKVGSETYVDLHIEVNPQMTVTAGHDTARNVRKNITEALENITDVLVHVEPSGHQTMQDQQRLAEEYKRQIYKIAKQIKGANNIHNVIIHNQAEESSAELHIEIDPKMDVANSHKIADLLERKIIKQTDLTRVIVHVEPLEDTPEIL